MKYTLRLSLFAFLGGMASAFSGMHHAGTLHIRSDQSPLASTTTLDAMNRRLNTPQMPGSELFPTAGSSYVPSGMTREQYEEIKRQERAEQDKKEFASWGPKFARSERPDGDWMVVPSLWTGGFDGNSKKRPATRTTEKINSPSPALILVMAARVRKALPLYALAFLLVECMFTSAFLLHKKHASSMIAFMAFKLKRSTDAMVFSMTTVAKFTGIKLILAPLFIKSLGDMVERCNKELRWSPRRTMIYTALSSVGMVSAWGLLLMGLKLIF